MAQELAPSDWTHQTFDDAGTTLRGIVRVLDEHLGIGLVASGNYSRGGHLVFFLEDIDNNPNGFPHGIAEGDNVEFEVCEMAPRDRDHCHQSYLFQRHYKISIEHVSFNLVLLEPGTVVLEELLWDQPRYEGVIVTEPLPSIQHHVYGSYYGDEEPRGGLIRLNGAYRETVIPPLSERYKVPDSTPKKDGENDSDSRKKKVLLQPGTMLHFEGRDLLSTRSVLRKGDRVEFDVYRDKANRDVPFGATNILFLDNDKEKRMHGFISRFLSRSQPVQQFPGAQPQKPVNDQKFGLLKVECVFHKI